MGQGGRRELGGVTKIPVAFGINVKPQATLCSTKSPPDLNLFYACIGQWGQARYQCLWTSEVRGLIFPRESRQQS